MLAICLMPHQALEILNTHDRRPSGGQRGEVGATSIPVPQMNIFRYLGVLVVDDDPLFCVLTEETLRLLGCEDVSTACSTVAGMRMLDHCRPSIIIVNVDRDRDDLWRTLALERHRGCLAVATSFDRDGRTRIGLVGRGADAFLSKPFTKTQLLSTMTRLLVGAAGRRCKVVPLRGDHGSAGPVGGSGRQHRPDAGGSVR